MRDSELDAAVLHEVAESPGQRGLAVVESFFAVDHIPRHLVSGSIAYLVSHGRLTLDGEQRLWPAATN